MNNRSFIRQSISRLLIALSGLKFLSFGGKTEKVFGIGWAKTGTTTLARCLQILGYNHQGQRMDLVDGLREGNLSGIMSVVRAHDSFDDWPWIILFKELDALFPNSKFILTRRDPERWIASYRNMLRGKGIATERQNEVRKILYNLPFPNVSDEQLLQRYNDHNAEVIAHFDSRPNSLLVVDWEHGDSWEEICGFLQMDIPAVSFPHENRGIYR